MNFLVVVFLVVIAALVLEAAYWLGLQHGWDECKGAFRQAVTEINAEQTTEKD